MAYQIKKYKQSHCIKYQLLSGLSGFAINGGSEDGNESVYKGLEEEAEDICKEKNYKYYIIERYTEPNYGIMGVNLRVYNSKEDLDKELERRQKAEIRAQKEYQKYLIKKAKEDEERALREEKNKKLLEKLQKSNIYDSNKIKVTLSSYNNQLTVEVSDKEVEKILENKKVEYKKEGSKLVLGYDYLDYKVVNKIINWLNKNNNEEYKYEKITEKYHIRKPMAYCVLDEKKYPDKSNRGYCIDGDIFDKLIDYETIAFDVYTN